MCIDTISENHIMERDFSAKSTVWPAIASLHVQSANEACIAARRVFTRSARFVQPLLFGRQGHFGRHPSHHALLPLRRLLVFLQANRAAGGGESRFRHALAKAAQKSHDRNEVYIHWRILSCLLEANVDQVCRQRGTYDLR
jgi:hypothetical protein